jgi:hypothetical protein
MPPAEFEPTLSVGERLQTTQPLGPAMLNFTVAVTKGNFSSFVKEHVPN